MFRSLIASGLDGTLLPQRKAIAFGNSFNDVSMLNFAGRAYIMEEACSEWKGRFPRRRASVMEALGQINEAAGGIWK